MAYAQLKFTADFEAAQQAGMSFHGMAGVLDSISASEAWALYINTASAPLRMQIFGRHNFDQDAQVVRFMRSVPVGESRQLPGFMQGITKLELDNFGKANAQTPGSALLVGRDSWNLTVNDVWVCGAVHAKQSFHPASPINARNIFHPRWVLTITGRELVGLALAGYISKTGHQTLEQAYVPSSASRAENLNLVDYQVKVSELTTVEKARQFFADAGFVIP